MLQFKLSGTANIPLIHFVGSESQIWIDNQHRAHVVKLCKVLEIHDY